MPVFPGGNRQVYVPFRATDAGHLAIPVIATCVVGGQRVDHHVYIEVCALEKKC